MCPIRNSRVQRNILVLVEEGVGFNVNILTLFFEGRVHPADGPVRSNQFDGGRLSAMEAIAGNRMGLPEGALVSHVLRGEGRWMRGMFRGAIPKKADHR